jgi:hypothetical protein
LATVPVAPPLGSELFLEQAIENKLRKKNNYML